MGPIEFATGVVNIATQLAAFLRTHATGMSQLRPLRIAWRIDLLLSRATLGFGTIIRHTSVLHLSMRRRKCRQGGHRSKRFP